MQIYFTTPMLQVAGITPLGDTSLGTNLTYTASNDVLGPQGAVTAGILALNRS